MVDDPNMPESEKKSWVRAEGLFQVGAMMVIAPLLGYFIGSWLDDKAHTTWIKIAGLLLGIAAGFVQLVRIAGREK